MNSPLNSLEINPQDFEGESYGVKQLADFCYELLVILKYLHNT